MCRLNSQLQLVRVKIIPDPDSGLEITPSVVGFEAPDVKIGESASDVDDPTQVVFREYHLAYLYIIYGKSSKCTASPPRFPSGKGRYKGRGGWRVAERVDGIKGGAGGG